MNNCNLINNISDKLFVALSFPIITIYYIIIGLQGFDMCDEGWVLTGYQQFFNDPESVEYLFLYYSTQFVGALWNNLFGSWGILGFRILAAITMASCFAISYFILKRHISKREFVIGTLLVLTSETTGLLVFHHNQFTMLLYCLSVYLLYKSIERTSLLMILASGFVVGIASFARLPNISLLALSLTLIPFAYKFGLGLALRYFANFLAGFFCGIAIILGIMALFDHMPIFVECVLSGLSAAEDIESTHNLSYMIKYYLVKYYIDIIKYVVFIFSFVFLILLVKNKIINKNLKNCLFIAATILFVTLILISVFKDSRIKVIYVFCTFWLLWGMYYYRYNFQVICLIIISLVIMNFLPLGSDLGIGNMGSSCVIISIPLTVHVARQIIGKIRVFPLTVSLLTFVSVYTATGFIQILSQCYFDVGWRWEKKYKINSTLATTYTTYNNKIAADELLAVLPKYISEGDYTFFFQSLATLHYLTKTKPYLGNPWPWTYDPSNFERQIIKAQIKHNKLPIIVRQKSSLSTWQTPDENWNNDKAVQTYLHKNGRIKSINNFIKDNSYEILWENDLFQILKTKNNLEMSL